jgi:CspA family cold shock protein
MSDVLQGTIIFFTKSYGFIAPQTGGQDVFVHYSDIEMEGYKTLKKGQRVSYQLGLNIRGQPKAVSVSIIV